MSKLEIVGIYRIEATETVHLIEVTFNNVDVVPDLIGFTQALPDQPRENWQVPYDECLLDSSGSSIIDSGGQFSPDHPELWKGNVRMAFFFHDLDLAKPIRTPYGEMVLPREEKLPGRLTMIKYDPPD